MTSITWKLTIIIVFRIRRFSSSISDLCSASISEAKGSLPEDTFTLASKTLIAHSTLNIWEVKSFIRMSANQQNWCDLKGLFWSEICVLISSRGLFGLLRLKQSPVCPWSDRKKLEDQIQGSYLWCASCALHKTTNFDNTFKILCPWNWKIRFRASAQNLQCASCALHKTEQMW